MKTTTKVPLKLCSTCGTIKPKTDFYPRYKNNPTGPTQPKCKPCYTLFYGYEYRKSLKMKHAGLL